MARAKFFCHADSIFLRGLIIKDFPEAFSVDQELFRWKMAYGYPSSRGDWSCRSQNIFGQRTLNERFRYFMLQEHAAKLWLLSLVGAGPFPPILG
jgi:hypothetical protein